MKQPKIGKTLYLDEDLISRIEIICKVSGTSISWIVNKILKDNEKEIINYLNENRKKLKIKKEGDPQS